jgi:hypothetical protein
MRIGHPTEDELRENFAEMLESVRNGGGLRTETGLDMETEEALWDIAKAYPEVTEQLVEGARSAFAGQLDGSNTRRHHEDLQRKLDELRRLHGRGTAGSAVTGWAEFTAGLSEEIAELPFGAVLKLIGYDLPDEPRGVQVLRDPDMVSAELIGINWFEGADASAVAAAGWQEPDAAHGNVSWWIDCPRPLTTARCRELAAMIVTGLRDGLKVPEPADLRYRAWDDNAEGRALDLPRLGVRAVPAS